MKDTRLYIKVVGTIQELIGSGHYQPGSRLPPERQLAEMLGVSRPTVREAIIALEAKGVLAVKTGSGVYVLDPSESTTGLGGSVSAFELVELRVLVEGEAAAMAASMVTEEELEALREQVALMERVPEKAAEADRQFHKILAKSARNRALAEVIHQLWVTQEQLVHIRQAHEAVCMKDDAQRVAEHRAIVDALSARDPGAARTAMRRHFSRMLTALHETNEERAVEEVKQRAREMRARFSFDRLVSNS